MRDEYVRDVPDEKFYIDKTSDYPSHGRRRRVDSVHTEIIFAVVDMILAFRNVFQIKWNLERVWNES